MATWLLPDNIADVLPRQAGSIESMRRTCLDLFRVHGFELIQPPMIEFVDSLLSGSGSDLDNNTFKFMDQANGRMVGLRADMTPQAARIDAHILNCTGVSRLCYAGSCLHARPMHPLASREPYVAGAELFGAGGADADAEVVSLAVQTLRALGVEKIHMDFGHTGVLRSLLGSNSLAQAELDALVRGLRMKDPVAVERASQRLDAPTQKALQILLVNFGGREVLATLREQLAQYPKIVAAIDEVEQLADNCGADETSFDFCDVHGYRYLTGVTFSVNIPQYAQAILRGGRYDGIGLAFGRFRPACGFTIYLRALASVPELEQNARSEAVISRGLCGPEYETFVRELRREGKIVIALLMGESSTDLNERFTVTHEIVRTSDGFELRACDPVDDPKEF